MTNNGTGVTDYTGSICPKCGKPYIYIGDETTVPMYCTCKKDADYIGDEINPYTPIGWQCPNCKRIYAPHVDDCKFCNSLTRSIEVNTAVWEELADK